ncbi:MAG: hypothetical protein FWE09_01700 [Treponema sp.]|nr:hypothetical protein [Treponema sp.]
MKEKLYEYKAEIQGELALAPPIALCYTSLMNVTRIVDVPATRRITIDVPSEVPTGRVTLTFTPNQEKPKEKESAFGCLQRFADPSKIPGEKGAWELAALEKHGKD